VCINFICIINTLPNAYALSTQLKYVCSVYAQPKHYESNLNTVISVILFVLGTVLCCIKPNSVSVEIKFCFFLAIEQIKIYNTGSNAKNSQQPVMDSTAN
jgi:hypothetical protein